MSDTRRRQPAASASLKSAKAAVHGHGSYRRTTTASVRRLPTQPNPSPAPIQQGNDLLLEY